MKALRLAQVVQWPLPAFPSHLVQQSGVLTTAVASSTHRCTSIRSFAASSSTQAPDSRQENTDTQPKNSASSTNDSSREQSARPAAMAAPQMHSQESITSQFNDLIAPRKPPNRAHRKPLGLNSAQSVMADRQGALADQLGLPMGDISRSMQSSYGGLATGMPPDLPHRLDAYIGRSQSVSRYTPLAAAIRMMDMKLSANKVRTEFQQQRFHERPGLKRKRLKSLRWRKRFNEGFKATVAKVIRMRNMGW